MEAKKLFMLSEWQLERCSESAPKDLCDGGSLENPLPNGDDPRARAQAWKLEVVGKKTWKIGELAGDLKDEVFDFLLKNGADLNLNDIPDKLVHLIVGEGGKAGLLPDVSTGGGPEGVEAN
jgi:hypothetical protein